MKTISKLHWVYVDSVLSIGQVFSQILLGGKQKTENVHIVSFNSEWERVELDSSYWVMKQ